MTDRYRSWGRFPRADQSVSPLHWRSDPIPRAAREPGPYLPFGNGRSYGDVCLNDQGHLLDCRGLSRLISFSRESGLIRAEGGVLFSELIDVALPQGWFLPVTPGTQYVTLAGAIANDVHGKNHHRAGSLGSHIRSLELQRSDGSRLYCSELENPEWFRATIGGLGLTGGITWAELQLMPVRGPFLQQETRCFASLPEFFSRAAESDQRFEYTFAWLDTRAVGASPGRGVLFRANHCDDERRATRGRGALAVPFELPFSLINRTSARLFNTAYYRLHQGRAQRLKRVHYEPFFYPLDRILNWKRVYGSRGFLQYQVVIPSSDAEAAVSELLGRTAAASSGSFLSVLKCFGHAKSPGMLSFPRPGVTLALDFPNRGAETLQLLDQLDEITRTARGSLYPAKDARMSAADFQRSYPQWREFADFKDPNISSSFWRRVTRESA